MQTLRLARDITRAVYAHQHTRCKRTHRTKSTQQHEDDAQIGMWARGDRRRGCICLWPRTTVGGIVVPEATNYRMTRRRRRQRTTTGQRDHAPTCARLRTRGREDQGSKVRRWHRLEHLLPSLSSSPGQLRKHGEQRRRDSSLIPAVGCAIRSHCSLRPRDRFTVPFCCP